MERDLRAEALAELAELADAISGPLMLWSNEVLVGRRGGLAAVEYFRGRQYVILGFDGFDTDGIVLMPRSDFIADFSSIDGKWSQRVTQSADASLDVLSRWEPGPQFVTFVLAKSEES